MKTKTLENGTILEVGKKYKKQEWTEAITITHLSKEVFIYEDGISEYAESYNYSNRNWNLQPYQEPKKMVKLYNYAYFAGGKWLQSQEFFRNDKDYVRRCIYTDKFIRLDHTMIEVEDYD
jgi:hypothetical protein